MRRTQLYGEQYEEMSKSRVWRVEFVVDGQLLEPSMFISSTNPPAG
jgi:hypothetical protein